MQTALYHGDLGARVKERLRVPVMLYAPQAAAVTIWRGSPSVSRALSSLPLVLIRHQGRVHRARPSSSTQRRVRHTEVHRVDERPRYSNEFEKKKAGCRLRSPRFCLQAQLPCVCARILDPSPITPASSTRKNRKKGTSKAAFPLTDRVRYRAKRDAERFRPLSVPG